MPKVANTFAAKEPSAANCNRNRNCPQITQIDADMKQGILHVRVMHH